VDESFTVLGGNMRFEALKANGLKEIPDEWVKRASELTPEQKREFVVKDNAGFGEWDWDALANEWSELPLAEWGVDLPEEWLQGNGHKEEDEGAVAGMVDRAAELQEKWKVERGQVWQVGRHRLMCGDSTSHGDLERLLEGKSVDCVFTSPPYAVGVDYGEYADTIENLRAMLPKLSRLWLERVYSGGFAVVNFSDIASGRNIAETQEPCEYPMALEYWPVFRSDGWLLWSRRVWCKPNPRVHSLQCIGSNRAATDWEHVWTWKKPGEPIVKRVDGEHPSPLGWVDTTRDVGVEVGKETHGAGMATLVAMRMVNVHSRPGHAVLEPFTGTGTTIVACEELGREAFGMEQAEKFCAVTLERLSALGLTPELQK
jgi:DNA modification methylase